MNHKLFVIFVCLTLSSNIFAQTYSWSGYTAGSTSYTTGIMTATVTSTNPGFQNSTPRHYAAATVGSGQCGIAGGLALENMFGNVTNAHATVTMSFTSGNTTNGTCASMQFQIKDINADESNQTFRDFVHISAIDGNNMAIPVANIVLSGGSNKAHTTSGGTTRIIGGSTGSYGSRSTTACDNITVTITPPAGTPLRSITIRYQPSYEAASGSTGYWNFSGPYRPAYQYISISSLTGTATSGCTVLPIELRNFNANCDRNERKLEWETITETNNRYFYIEGSENGEDFFNIEKLEGAGNSAHINYYQWNLNDDSEKIKFFRLKQEDVDGRISYSDIISIHCNTEINISVYPNPANENLFISANGEINLDRIEIYDLMGRMVMQKKYSENDTHIFELNILDLPNAYYTIGIIDKNNALIKSVKFVKE